MCLCFHICKGRFSEDAAHMMTILLLQETYNLDFHQMHILCFELLLFSKINELYFIEILTKFCLTLDNAFSVIGSLTTENRVVVKVSKGISLDTDSAMIRKSSKKKSIGIFMIATHCMANVSNLLKAYVATSP